MSTFPYTISRRIEIDAAHRVPLHASKCKNIHGHRYVIEAECSAIELIDQGQQSDMVLDFGFLKQEMILAIYEPCDHGIILCSWDPLLDALADFDTRTMLREAVHKNLKAQFIKPPWKVYLIRNTPTAEVLAEHWFSQLSARVKAASEGAATLTEVRVWETPNCMARFNGSQPTEGR